jgi:hypothetical protein
MATSFSVDSPIQWVKSYAAATPSRVQSRRTGRVAFVYHPERRPSPLASLHAWLKILLDASVQSVSAEPTDYERSFVPPNNNAII